MPATSTAKLSVQVSDFEDKCLLIQLACLIYDFCSSSQRFACGFLQIPPRDGHPCRPANDSPCRVRRRLSLPSKSALPGAHRKAKSSGEDLALRFIPPSISFSFSDVAEGASATDLENKRTLAKNLKSDGHLITEDSVLPTTAPGGAPEQNRCYQTPATLFVLPLAPASLARSAHLAPLTTLRPRWGLAPWLVSSWCPLGLQ